ncbi:MAG: hypothetical protein JXL84_24260 [Deltaproteobacteria bacterium]|nr:hypothetical protein [Deltaproteobacteria bacterium]
MRDLIRLRPIRKNLALKDLLRVIASSVGSRTSYNRLGKALGLSVDSVKEYVGYLESAFLLKGIEKWTMKRFSVTRLFLRRADYFATEPPIGS